MVVYQSTEHRSQGRKPEGQQREKQQGQGRREDRTLSPRPNRPTDRQQPATSNPASAQVSYFCQIKIFYPSTRSSVRLA